MFWEDDITWCGNSEECSNINCFRHLNNRKPQPAPDIFTISCLKNIDEYCQGFKEKE